MIYREVSHLTYSTTKAFSHEMRILLSALALLMLLAHPGFAQRSTFSIELEAGPLWQSRNEVEIPNDGSATRFALDRLTGSGPWPGGRLYVGWNPWSRHGFRILLAPLSLTETGMSERSIRFAGREYESGRPVEATYTFNSYRLSYRYLLYPGEQTSVWIGFTAKIRDATIALEQGPVSSRKDDLGFVPLVHLAGSWEFSPRWQLGLDADALAGGPGRAVDAAIEVGYDLSPRWTVQTGYRTVEGGADVEEVYAFAWLHYPTVSLRWSN